MGPNTALSMDSDCDPIENLILEFVSHQIILSKSATAKSGVVNQECQSCSFEAVDQQLDVEKLKDRL